jgi:hypothetical protein
MRVHRAYLLGAVSRRVLADALGRIYHDGTWVREEGELITVGAPHYSWSDVPRAWIGVSPWWRATTRQDQSCVQL